MSNKTKAETLRLKSRRAAMNRLAHRPLDHISLEVRAKIERGEKHL